ncbi:MAG: hypothetical protein ABSC89_00930 [Verrucomicrobiota bacterium]|jgi:hypothetical protein
MAKIINPQIPKIVYLFGAGATHAELVNLYPDEIAEGKFWSENGLLMTDVSRRVCEKARNHGLFSTEISPLISSAGLSNIELFISLIKNNGTDSENTIINLERIIENDISSRLPAQRRRKFYLHKSVLELHKHSTSEQLIGLISLNYDNVLDEAYKAIYKETPDYCLSSRQPNKIPLLKLHGGFDLEYRGHKLSILTPGINKNYLQLPYNFVWGRALEILIECDILRIIGCSLSQNDTGLIDLFFKAHLERGKPFEIQMISFDPPNNSIKEQYGFLPQIRRALEIEGGITGGIISDPKIQDPTTGANPFKIWLKAKIQKMLAKRAITDFRDTTYLEKLLLN